ncbi:MAG: glutaredoxin domain-containing protein [Patescibacteria group bacterium]
MSTGKKVIIYSTPFCVYCQTAKEFFKKHNIDYLEYDISVDTAKREEMIKKTGYMAVPVIEIENEIIMGFDKQKISQLLGI